MPKASRDKGKRGEREFAEVLRAHGFTARRGVQYQGGPESPDVVCDELPHIHFEVKRAERLELDAALLQAECEAKPWQLAIVVHRKNRTNWCAILPFEHLVQLLKAKPKP